MDTIRDKKIKITKKIYISQESGFAVFKVSEKENVRNTHIITGNLFDVKEGDFLRISGDFVNHLRFGRQIKVTKFEFILPQDTDGIVKYLSSGRIKGMGKKTAVKIVDKFGLATFEILEMSPGRLHEIKGLRKSLITEIKQSFNDNRIIRDLTVKLSLYGIGHETIFKIFKEYGEGSFDILQHNPYILIDRIRGVGFKTADIIAQGFGIAITDPIRIKSGLNFLLALSEQRNGDLYAERLELINRGAELLAISGDEIDRSLDNLIEKNELLAEEIPQQIILSFKNYTVEKMIARFLYRLTKSHSFWEPKKVDFDHLLKRTAVELTEEQKRAVYSTIKNRITIITGGPGTGKTTIIKAIIELFLKESKSVLICAPTGRAAKRVEEASLYSASTIHRMLKINPETRTFIHDENNPLKADAVIVDEFSMVDSYLFISLLKALSLNTRLILIGDKDQLPSVGPGNILRDLISSDYFNIIYLNRNFRQSEGSLIIENAYRINKGKNLLIEPYSDELDFIFLKADNENQASAKVLKILDYYKSEISFNSFNIQVLAPMYRGQAGIDNLNYLIQKQFNLNRVLFKKEKIQYQKMDKVMQLKNNYEKEIFNGEQGIVMDYNPDDKILFVDFDGYPVEYTTDEVDELTLSYAVSVHKSQGSEYDFLILVLLPCHSIMLNRELFYTAVTRAKKKIFLISDGSTIQKAIFNSSPRQRKTLLPLRLKEVFEL